MSKFIEVIEISLNTVDLFDVSNYSEVGMYVVTDIELKQVWSGYQNQSYIDSGLAPALTCAGEVIEVFDQDDLQYDEAPKAKPSKKAPVYDVQNDLQYIKDVLDRIDERVDGKLDAIHDGLSELWHGEAKSTKDIMKALKKTPAKEPKVVVPANVGLKDLGTLGGFTVDNMLKAMAVTADPSLAIELTREDV